MPIGCTIRNHWHLTNRQLFLGASTTSKHIFILTSCFFLPSTNIFAIIGVCIVNLFLMCTRFCLHFSTQLFTRLKCYRFRCILNESKVVNLTNKSNKKRNALTSWFLSFRSNCTMLTASQAQSLRLQAIRSLQKINQHLHMVTLYTRESIIIIVIVVIIILIHINIRKGNAKNGLINFKLLFTMKNLDIDGVLCVCATSVLFSNIQFDKLLCTTHFKNIF